jgi:predicted transcriptional regulator
MANKTEHSIRLSDEKYKKVKTTAKKEKRTIKAIIEISIEQYLQNPAKDNANSINQK